MERAGPCVNARRSFFPERVADGIEAVARFRLRQPAAQIRRRRRVARHARFVAELPGLVVEIDLPAAMAAAFFEADDAGARRGEPVRRCLRRRSVRRRNEVDDEEADDEHEDQGKARCDRDDGILRARAQAALRRLVPPARQFEPRAFCPRRLDPCCFGSGNFAQRSKPEWSPSLPRRCLTIDERRGAIRQ